MQEKHAPKNFRHFISIKSQYPLNMQNLKKNILEKDTPLLFKVSNHVFGIAFIIMDIFIFYVNR